MKTIIALALVICQLFSPMAATAKTGSVNNNGTSFIEMCAVVGAAYEGAWYYGANVAIADDPDSVTIEESYAEAAQAADGLSSVIFAAIGFGALRDVAVLSGADLKSMVGETVSYEELCKAAYLGYIVGYSYGYDETAGGDISESVSWSYGKIQEKGDDTASIGDGIIGILEDSGLMPEMEDGVYADLCFLSGCSHNVGWSIGYDRKSAEDNNEEYTAGNLLNSVLWAADWVQDEENDITSEGRYSFETVYTAMGNDVTGFEDMTFSVQDFLFAAGCTGAMGLYEELYGDEDNTQVAEELNNIYTQDVVYLGLDYLSQFFLAYFEGRIVVE